MQHPTHLIFSFKECELAEWVSIVSRMKQNYLHIQKSAVSSHKMCFNHNLIFIVFLELEIGLCNKIDQFMFE